MNRLWSRVGFRAASIALLVAGLAAGVHLGQGRKLEQRAVGSSETVPVEIDEMQLLKRQQGEHAATRAWQSRAEGAAAEKAADVAKAAAVVAKAAADRAHERETRARAAKRAAEARRKAVNSRPVPYSGPIPGSCDDYRGSRAVGCALMLAAGFELDQFPCLDKLWKRESGWHHQAENRGSGAYGIPQALPGSKMAAAGADWRTNPATQISWGLGYVQGRYQTPCRAWSHFQNAGSY